MYPQEIKKKQIKDKETQLMMGKGQEKESNTCMSSTMGVESSAYDVRYLLLSMVTQESFSTKLDVVGLTDTISSCSRCICKL